jgi:hypothetical protein
MRIVLPSESNEIDMAIQNFEPTHLIIFRVAGYEASDLKFTIVKKSSF